MQTREMSPPPAGAGSAGQREASDDGAGETKEAIAREVEDARQRLASAARDLRAEAGDAGATLASSVTDAAERGKDEAAEGLRAFSSAIRRASDELGARDASIPARLAQEAAHGLERLSEGLQARTVADMSRSVGDFGRQNPAAFLTGCLLAGVAIGRLLVASGDRAHGYDAGSHDDRRGGSDDYRPGGAEDYRPGGAYDLRPDAQPSGPHDHRASRAQADFEASGASAAAAPATGPATSTTFRPDRLAEADPPKPAGVDDDFASGRPAAAATTGGRDGEL